jgi:hypothetical protein
MCGLLAVAVFDAAPAPTISASLPAFARPVPTLGRATQPSIPVTRSAGQQQSEKLGPVVQTSAAENGGHVFGISDPALPDETAAQQKADLTAMKSIGINSLRMDANWAAVQPSGPASSDWGALDETVSLIRAAGMSVDLTIDGTPQWAATADSSRSSAPTPASPAQYATFAAEVAAHFAPMGVSVFEIWNEPNISEFWQPAPDPQAYTAILKAAYLAIKLVVPSATVISGGLAPAATTGTEVSPIDFLKAMYAGGAKGSFDGLGFHPYSFPVTPDTYEPWSAWSQMNQTTPSLRSVMADYGDSGKKIWITEYGAPSSGPDGIGQAAQAESLEQAINQAATTNWIGAIYLYTWVDSGDSPTDHGDEFGLLTEDGSQKAAFHGVASSIESTRS